MSRTPDAELERLKREVSLIRLIETNIGEEQLLVSAAQFRRWLAS